MNNLYSSRKGRLSLMLLLGLAVIMVVSACGGGDGPVEDGVGDEGAALPTAVESSDVGEEAGNAAADSFEQTWENYRSDSIAEQVKQRESNTSLRQRYEAPSITEQYKDSIVTDIDFLEDRTEWNTSGGTASANVEYDIRVTYLNGDSETRTCQYIVQIELYEDENLWYILNPSPLQFLAVCIP